jgi:hypothetical protein
MTAHTTRSIACPMHAGNTGPLSCNDEQVEIDLGTFASTTYSVAPCSSLLAQGWTGPQEVGYISQAGRYFPAEPVGYQHRNGLVTFTGRG